MLISWKQKPSVGLEVHLYYQGRKFDKFIVKFNGKIGVYQYLPIPGEGWTPFINPDRDYYWSFK